MMDDGGVERALGLPSCPGGAEGFYTKAPTCAVLLKPDNATLSVPDAALVYADVW